MFADVLAELSYLVSSQKAIEVIRSCRILKALAHTGTFRNAIITAGLKKAMENITRYKLSAFSRLTVSNVIIYMIVQSKSRHSRQRKINALLKLLLEKFSRRLRSPSKCSPVSSVA